VRVFIRRNAILVLVTWLTLTCSAIHSRAQEQPTPVVPNRAKGISMHMLPKRVADLGPMQWGLVVSHAGDWKPQQKEIVFQNTQDFVQFVRAQNREVQEWRLDRGD